MKVSIICACKNREKPLYASIGSWLLKKEVHEVIIVDWSSNEPLHPLTKLDSRVKVIRVDGEKYFNMPEPLNLAASVATGDALLTMATDYFFNPYAEYNFFDAYPIDDKTFIGGTDTTLSGRLYGEPIFKYLMGVMYVTKENFDKVGGYREVSKDYFGNEDYDLNERLKMIGLKQIGIDQNYTIFHIPHTDRKRIENFKSYNEDHQFREEVFNSLSQSFSGDELQWQFDYIMSQRLLQQSKESLIQNIDDKKVDWELVKFNDQLYKAKKVIN
jgi:glycosyltransferase involved in cell wall biosynthesis